MTKKYNVFDFDGTIAINGRIPKENIEILESINHKVLNNSRSYKELPKEVHNLFDDIFCLNGAKYYKKKKLYKVHNSIDKQIVDKAIKFSIENEYNIAFNNTKSFFQNVNSVESIKFMESKGIKNSCSIEVPRDVWLVTISHNKKVKNFDCATRQSERVLEISGNTKAIVSKYFKVFLAFGDNENDVPMFETSDHFLKIKNANLSDVQDFINIHI